MPEREKINEQTDSEAEIAFKKMITDSGNGGANTDAYSIAAALYGGHPPADYVKKVQEGLDGEDH